MAGRSDADAADTIDIHRRHDDSAAELFGLPYRLVDIGNRHVDAPHWRHAAGLRRDLHDAGHRLVPDLTGGIGAARHLHVLRAPAEQRHIERLGRGRIGGHQLAPAEGAARIEHIHRVLLSQLGRTERDCVRSEPYGAAAV
jgi:hypothetical protein